MTIGPEVARSEVLTVFWDVSLVACCSVTDFLENSLALIFRVKD
jgi:hypothetical protein